MGKVLSVNVSEVTEKPGPKKDRRKQLKMLNDLVYKIVPANDRMHCGNPGSTTHPNSMKPLFAFLLPLGDLR